jgi:taurine dioxygenase
MDDAPFQIRAVTWAVGAEIHGVDLREELPQRTIDALERALLEHGVLFFRNQHITPAQQVAFSARFGQLLVHPFGHVHPEHPELVILDQVRPVGEGTDIWHCDTSYLPEPPMGSVLRAVKLPSRGGDTCFASAEAAWEALSPPLKEMTLTLRALHDIAVPMERAIRFGDSRLSIDEARAEFPPVSHPVVRTHPVTGRRALFVTRNATTRIEGLSERESDWLLSLLCDHLGSPTFQCRFHWEPGSVVFWDNRSTQHYAVPDYDERRVMHRTTLIGDRPF